MSNIPSNQNLTVPSSSSSNIPIDVNAVRKGLLTLLGEGESNSATTTAELAERYKELTAPLRAKYNLPDNQNKSEIPDAQSTYIPQNTNQSEIATKNFAHALNKARQVFGRVKGTIGAIPLVGGMLKEAVENVTSINTWIKAATGGKGAEYIMNIDHVSNEAIIAYLVKLAKSPFNLIRLPLDIVNRELMRIRPGAWRMLLKSQLQMREKGVGVGSQALSLKYNSSGYIEETSITESDKIIRWNASSGSKKYKNNLLGVLKMVADVAKDLSMQVSKSHFKAGEEPAIPTYDFLKSFEFSDNYLWGCRIERFTEGEAECLLPAFGEYYDDGIWPITGCTFTKTSLQGTDLKTPYGNISLPFKSDYPKTLQVQVFDDFKRTFRYYLDNYTKFVFDKTHNAVIPYKHLVWKITVYQYDRTYSVMYEKSYLCVISEYNSPFLSAEKPGAEDTFEISFSIVGEILNASTDPAFKGASDTVGEITLENWKSQLGSLNSRVKKSGTLE